MEHTSNLFMYLFAIVFLLPCVLGSLGHLTQIASRIPGVQSGPAGWTVHGDPHPLEPITFKVLLKQRNLDQLEKIFWEVSDPKHANYGKFLKKHEVEAITAPEPASVNRVLAWLASNGVTSESMVIFPDYITVTLPVQHASALFSTSFSVYQNTKMGVTRTRISGPAHIPTELSNDIDFIAGISELFNNYHFDAVRHPVKPENATLGRARQANADQPVIPSVLNSYYGIPAGTAGSSTSNSLAIAAFDDYFSSGALAYFQTTFTLKKTVVSYVGPKCPYTVATCGQTESDLDMQYSTAIGSGVPASFIAHKGGEWVLDWGQQLVAMASPPLINSASYGWAETEQCQVTSACTTLGYSNNQYVARTDTAFQTLGARGVSILVSSGDDGAPAFYNGVGNCPMDAAKYCPIGGCAHTTTTCAEITITKTGVTGACYFPMGLNSDQSNCNTFVTASTFNGALQAFITANPTCNIAIETDADGNPHFYTTCACASLKATTSATYTFTGYVYSATAAPTFMAMYPASSPYVTTVGATQFGWTGQTPTSEGVATILQGALITSGGGFSSFQTQPSYQASAVKNWLSNGANIPPTGSFNPANRAYPDIAFNGHFYVVYISSGTTVDACPCSSSAVDGTSCSSPALAGMFSLINDQLLNAGKPPLGFLNPLLYQMARDNPAAFNDITTGGNQCNRGYCCKYGYSGSAGWDPAGGLGSPVFAQMQSYIMSGAGGSAGTTLTAGALSLALPAALLFLSALLY